MGPKAVNGDGSHDGLGNLSAHFTFRHLVKRLLSKKATPIQRPKLYIYISSQMLRPCT